MVLVLAARGGPEPAQPVPPRAPADPLSYPEQGLRMARPRGWTAERRGGVIRLRSGDGQTVVAVLSAPRRVRPARMVRDLRAGLEKAHPQVRTVARRRTRLGDAPARSLELAATTAGGLGAEIEILAASSRWRTYGVTVFDTSPAPATASADLAAVLRSFEFSRPA